MIFLLTGAVDHQRVCEHGLVLGFRRRSTLVVPWSTLDPGRMRILERSSLHGTRATPFVWWLLGSPQPETLAQSLDPLPPREATDPVLRASGPPLPRIDGCVSRRR